MIEIDKSNIEKQIAGLKDIERKRQGVEVALENDWWSEKIITDEANALENGSLVEVPIDSPHYCLIGVLRRKEEPRSLTPQALSLLNKITDLWAQEVSRIAEDSFAVRLSVSSLFRTVEWQEDRIKKGLNAASVSPHQAGAAIDFDPNGYYLGEERRAVKRGSSEFKDGYIDVLKSVVEDLVRNGECHVIWEKNYRVTDNEIKEYDACWHVCVSPDFKA